MTSTPLMTSTDLTSFSMTNHAHTIQSFAISTSISTKSSTKTSYSKPFANPCNWCGILHVWHSTYILIIGISLTGLSGHPSTIVVTTSVVTTPTNDGIYDK